MKKQSVLTLLIAVAARLAAQLQPGAAAPDFTAQDLAGQSWHLYELLGQGKIVVLEISTTWCPPCWAYHNSHALQDLYAAHGPDGDEKLQVFFVEADPGTDVECLYGPSGCNSFTPGNWVNGTTYPYLNDAAVADSFQVGYFPTVFLICPNQKAYQVGQLSADELWEKAAGCPVASGINNAGIFDFSTGTGLNEICDGLDVQPAFSLINLGSNLLTSATFTLQWNNGLEQTKQWYGSLPLYGEALVSFDSLLLDSPGTLKTTLTSVNNNAGDDDFSNNVHNDAFTSAAQFNSQQIVLKIRTDDYGAETYWELRDDNGNELYHGGNSNVGPNGGGTFGNALPGPGAYGSNLLINKTLTLPADGCYSLLVVDAYGDGMCCDYGNGYYKLYNANNPAVPILTGGEFGATEQRGFKVQTTTGAFAPDNSLSKIQIFPNPASDVLNLAFDLAEPSAVSLGIDNPLGQSVYRMAPQPFVSGEHQIALPVEHWPAGTYLARFQTGSQVQTMLFRVSD